MHILELILSSIRILSEDFSYVPVTGIRQIMLEKKRLFPAYLTLASFEHHDLLWDEPTKPYVRLKHTRKTPVNNRLDLFLRDRALAEYLQQEHKAASEKFAELNGK